MQFQGAIDTKFAASLQLLCLSLMKLKMHKYPQHSIMIWLCFLWLSALVLQINEIMLNIHILGNQNWLGRKVFFFHNERLASFTNLFPDLFLSENRADFTYYFPSHMQPLKEDTAFSPNSHGIRQLRRGETEETKFFCSFCSYLSFVIAVTSLK